MIDWTEPLVTNTGASATVLGVDHSGRRVQGDFGDGCDYWWFDITGWCGLENSFGERIYVRNAPETTKPKPFLATMDAEIERLEADLAALKAARLVLTR